jgi:hypothetical protein
MALDYTLLLLLPMVAYGVICSLLGWRDRATHDPRHIGVVGRVMEPPDELPPALAAWLLKTPEVTPMRLAIATLLDLARRGHLRLERRPSLVDPRRQRLTLLRLDQRSDTLAPFEAALLATLLEDAAQVDLTRGAGAPLWQKGRLQNLCEAELAERGLLDRNGPRRRRAHVVNNWILAALAPVAIALTVAVADGVAWWGWTLLALGVLLCWGLGGMYEDVRGTTQRGSDARAAWSGFATYLRQLSPEEAPEGRFEELLPHAVALGAQKPLLGAYAVRGVALPAWYAAQLPGPVADGRTMALEQLRDGEPATRELRELIGELERELSLPPGD